MSMLKTKSRVIFCAFVILVSGALLFGCRPSVGKMSFAQKDCLDCHKKFADQYFSMKNVHSVVKEKKCEGCHLRHGIVPKLLLKK